MIRFVDETKSIMHSPVLKKSNTIEKLKEQITEIPAAKHGRGRPPKLDSKSSAERSANYRAKKRGEK